MFYGLCLLLSSLRLFGNESLGSARSGAGYRTWYWHDPKCAATDFKYLCVNKDATCLIMKPDTQKENILKKKHVDS